MLKTIYKCDIPSKVKIGKNVGFPHDGMGVVIHPDAQIGDNVVVQHHVLIGEKNGTDVPIIGNNVVINPYAIIIGDVHVGDNCVIGDGSIVTKSIPANSVYYNKISPTIRELNSDEYKRITS